MGRRLNLILVVTLLLVFSTTNVYANTYEDVFSLYGFEVENYEELKETYERALFDHKYILEDYYHDLMVNDTVDVANSQIQELRDKSNTKLTELSIQLEEVLGVYSLAETLTVEEVFQLDREYMSLKKEIDNQEALLRKNTAMLIKRLQTTSEQEVASSESYIDNLEVKLNAYTPFGNIGTIENVPNTVSGGYITSNFGLRVDPFTDEVAYHSGMDIAVPVGTNVRSLFGGIVYAVDENNSLGKYITIDHGNGLKTIYGHLSDYVLVAGDIVNQGDVIALSGNTGRSTGPHVHLSMYIRGELVDPSILLGARR